MSAAGSPPAGVAVDASDPVVLVFIPPPLLLTVTSDATSVLEDVVPDAVVVPVADVSASVDADAPPVDSESRVLAVDEVALDPADSPEELVFEVEPAELVEDDSEDVPVVSAFATPGEVAIITPVPKAAANAPILPTYPPNFAALWTAFRDGARLVGTAEGEANSGLADGWISVMVRLRCRSNIGTHLDRSIK